MQKIGSAMAQANPSDAQGAQPQADASAGAQNQAGEPEGENVKDVEFEEKKDDQTGEQTQ
jgi:hypothetical protein